MESVGCEKQISLLSRLVAETAGRKPLLKKTPYSGDGRFFTEFSLPVIEFGPIGANYHANSEYVEIQNLEKYFNILSRFIQT